MVTVTGAFADEVQSRTATYLDQVDAATSHLPDALDAYGSDPDSFVASVDRLNARESECDATLRDLMALLGDSLPPNYTEVYLRADDVVQLYRRVDAIPNHAEQFVRQLASMEPSVTADTVSTFREMGSLIVEGTTLLTDITVAYVDHLVTSGDRVAIADDVETIVALESACDAHKYEGIQRAFEGCDTADALVVRELLLALDSAMDAVEDAAEYLLAMQSATL